MSVPHRLLRIAVALLLVAMTGSQRGGETSSGRSCLKLNVDHQAECSTWGRMSSTRTPYRAFKRTSYWNRPLPRTAPVARRSAEIISFLRADNTTNYVHLSGASSTGRWGNPIYWAGPSDSAYHVKNSCSLGQPREFSSVRIPDGARPDSTSDASMTVYERAKGLVYGFWRAAYDPATDTWSACGGTVYYLTSNGLAGSVPESDQPKNKGHHGVPPSTFAVRYGEVRAGQINHVLKIAVDTTKCVHVFPMAGDECGTWSQYAPPEGTRIRIKRWVHLTKLRLSPAARTVARALKNYGAIIGDQSGGPVELKLENTIAEGRGWKWREVLNRKSLARIPLRLFQVIRHGYGK